MRSGPVERESELAAQRSSAQLRQLLWTALVALLLTSCASFGGRDTIVVEREVLHMPMRLELHDPDEKRARAAIDRAIVRATAVGKRLLANRKTSQIGILNDFDPNFKIVLGPDSLEAAELALRLSDLTQHAYIPTRRPLLNVWGLMSGEPQVPTDAQIQYAVMRANMKTLDLDPKKKTARRLGVGTVIDLEGIAVGAMLDRALREIEGRGVPAAMVSIDGIWTGYWKGDDSPFTIEVMGRGPEGRPVPVAEVQLVERAFAIVYPREIFVTEDGTEIHEWIDPRSGRPVNDVVTAGVFAPLAMVAAPLAVAAFIDGDRAPEVLKRRPSTRWILSTSASGQRSSDGIPVRWRVEARD